MEKIIISGDYVEIEQYPVSENGKRLGRGDKENPSSESQKKLNEKNARKKLTRLINTNFGKQDLFVTLTHDKPVSESEGKRELTNFFRRVKDYRKKTVLPELKYIAVTETGEKGHREKGVHHHVICNDMSMDELERIWGKGRIQTSRLYPDENGYEGLARYFLKEGKEKNAKRWTQTKNLKKPSVKTRLIKRLNVYKPYKPPKALGKYKTVHVEITDNSYLGAYRYIQMVKLE